MDLYGVPFYSENVAQVWKYLEIILQDGRTSRSSALQRWWLPEASGSGTQRRGSSLPHLPSFAEAVQDQHRDLGRGCWEDFEWPRSRLWVWWPSRSSSSRCSWRWSWRWAWWWAWRWSWKSRQPRPWWFAERPLGLRPIFRTSDHAVGSRISWPDTTLQVQSVRLTHVPGRENRWFGQKVISQVLRWPAYTDWKAQGDGEKTEWKAGSIHGGLHGPVRERPSPCRQTLYCATGIWILGFPQQHREVCKALLPKW